MAAFPQRFALYGCLALSGSTSLVYELLWARILSFSMGSTSMAFAAVLAVFFLGLAGGAVLGGRAASGLRRPFLAYGILELAIGVGAGIIFPALFGVHHVFGWINSSGTEPSGIALRFLVATLLLAAPTVAMGATMPILLEHIRRTGGHLSEGLGRLYGVNTLGAFLGVYGATHWLIPHLGLDRTYFVTIGVNILVFGLVLAARERPLEAVSAGGTQDVAAETSPGSRRLRVAGLLLLGVSGFSTLGYEIVWSRVLTIAMEGSIYGIGATLGSFLAGIGLGGILFSLVARRLDSPVRLFRAYVVVALTVAGFLALSPLVMAVEGYFLRHFNHAMRDIVGLHLSFLTIVAALLPITAGFGFMFPAAVAIYNHGQKDPARGAGRAFGLNTLCSVTGSLLTAAFLMERLGIEGIVFLNALLLLTTLAAAVLLVEAEPAARRAWTAAVLAPLALTAGWWPEVNAKPVILTAYDGRPLSVGGLFRSLSAAFSSANVLKVYKDGVGSTLTVTLSGRSYGVQSNGLPQSGRSLDPPHYNLESSMVGLYPALHKPDARNALVVGLGAGITVSVLRKAGIPLVEVIELERSMPAIAKGIYPPGKSPLDDTGVTLHNDDARNYLVRNLHGETPRRWDLITSQPAHPWVSGAADLFTEEMFRLAYRSLNENGVFCQWFMPGSLDEIGFSALVNAFGNTFDSALVYRSTGATQGFYLVGSRGRLRIDLAKVDSLFARPDLRPILELNEHPRPEDVLRYAVTGVVPGKDLVVPGPINRDANAFIETRMPLFPKDRKIDLSRVKGIPFGALMPDHFMNTGTEESLFVMKALDGLSGNLPSNATRAEPDSIRVARLRLLAPKEDGPLSTYHRVHLDMAAGRLSPGSLDTLAERTENRLLRHQLRFLLLRKWPDFPGPDLPDANLASLPGKYQEEVATQWMLVNSALGRFRAADAVAAKYPVDSTACLMARLLEAHSALDHRLVDIGASGFKELYSRCLTAWTDKAGYLAALEWYCRAREWRDRIKMVAGLASARESKEVERRMSAGHALKAEMDFPGAARQFRQALELNPGHFNGYAALAETFGLAGRRSDFNALLEKAREIYPVQDALIYRLQEVFDLAGQSLQDDQARPH